MKNINLSISLPAIKKAFFATLHRFHVIIFVVTILGGLVVVVFLLNNTIISSEKPNDYTPETNTTTFDQATIKRVQELKTRDQNTDIIVAPGVRTNPFVE